MVNRSRGKTTLAEASLLVTREGKRDYSAMDSSESYGLWSSSPVVKKEGQGFLFLHSATVVTGNWEQNM